MGKSYLLFLGWQMNVTVILTRPWWNVYSVKSKSILFWSESLHWNLVRAGGCMSGNADGIGSNISVWSRWWCLELSEVKAEWTPCISQKNEGFLKLGMESLCSSIHFSVLPHFLTWADFRQIMPDCPWNLIFLYSKNMKTRSWVSNEAQTCKDSSLIFQTPVFSLNLGKAFWQPKFAGFTLV